MSINDKEYFIISALIVISLIFGLFDGVLFFYAINPTIEIHMMAPGGIIMLTQTIFLFILCYYFIRRMK